MPYAISYMQFQPSTLNLYSPLQGIKNPGDRKETHAYRGKAPSGDIIISKCAQCYKRKAYYYHNKGCPGEYRILIHSHLLFGLICSMPNIVNFTLLFQAIKTLFPQEKGIGPDALRSEDNFCLFPEIGQFSPPSPRSIIHNSGAYGILVKNSLTNKYNSLSLGHKRTHRIMDIDFNKNEDHNRLLLSELRNKLAKVKLGG